MVSSQPDTSITLRNLQKQFDRSNEPIATNFRALVSWIPYNSHRFTHQLHSYPAKVIPQIPNFFLAASSLVAANSLIVDPFSGSGTVALEACIHGHNAVISDSNPVARLITKVKTTPQHPAKLQKRILQLKEIVCRSRAQTPPDVVNLTYWYSRTTIKQLTRIASSVQKLNPSAFKRTCELALSVCARKASFADPRVSVPVKLNPNRHNPLHPLHAKTQAILELNTNLDVVHLFFFTLAQLEAQIASLWPIRCDLGRVVSCYENSLGQGVKSLSQHAPNSGDLMITSPPYLGAQKYIRATSLTIGWLSMAQSNELRPLEDLSIGREHFPKAEYNRPSFSELTDSRGLLSKIFKLNPLRAHMAVKYLSEMREVLATSYKIIKPGGKLILVSGSNMLCGQAFDTTNHLKVICKEIGFSLRLELTDTIKSRGLMTRRNRTAGLIPCEAVILFEK